MTSTDDDLIRRGDVLGVVDRWARAKGVTPASLRSVLDRTPTDPRAQAAVALAEACALYETTFRQHDHEWHENGDATKTTSALLVVRRGEMFDALARWREVR